jgi:flagellar assembly protein FliH
MGEQRVLKAYSLRELGQKVVFDFEDFHKHCGEQVAEARQQAEHYWVQAQREANALKDSAREKGFQAGYAAGMQQAAVEIHTKAEAKAKSEIDLGLSHGRKVLESLAKEIAHAKTLWLSQWETTAIGLCAAMAEKILRAELAARPNLSQTMVRELLELASSEQRVVAHVHPQDAETLCSGAGESPRFGTLVEFRPDPRLDRGDCIMELEQGELDGRIATQLARLTAELVPEQESGNGHD